MNTDTHNMNTHMNKDISVLFLSDSIDIQMDGKTNTQPTAIPLQAFT